MLTIPAYVSAETRMLHTTLCDRVDSALADRRIDAVLVLFKKLNAQEKRLCFEQLRDILADMKLL